MYDNLKSVIVLPRNRSVPDGSPMMTMPSLADIQHMLNGEPELLGDLTCFRSDDFDTNTRVAAFGIRGADEYNHVATVIMDGSRVLDGKREETVFDRLGVTPSVTEMIPVNGPVLMFYSDDEGLIDSIRAISTKIDA
ncbi:MAG: hypothetical protein KKH61_21440 [Gammaproteobacteria bacterium]|uniref:Uncharacterized protein n=1 Tax=viral metagenome TaxID=1070528 RepID=A0A6H1ZAM8_9ZZZZ|nr:hypothetical protein [Gammaproteobacteria bacterium]